MDDEIIVTEQKVIEFYEDELTAVRSEDGTVYVSVRHMCDALDIDRRGQVRRMTDHDILSEGLTRGGLNSPPSLDGRGGGIQMSILLRVDLVPLWLSGISAKRVKKSVQKKLRRYQREAGKVLWNAFQIPIPLMQESSAVQSLQQIEQMGLAIAQMAREQIEHERRIAKVEDRIDAAALVVLNIQNRLSTVERRVSPGNPISDEQAAEVAELVKAIATQFAQLDPEGGNYYQSIWSEIYRRFRVTSYKKIPQRHFAAVMEFLEAWASGYEVD